MLVFMLDRAALMTTKFMIPAACAMPECWNTLTNGLCATTVTPVAVHGTVGHDDGDRQHVEEEQAHHHGAQCRGNRDLRDSGPRRR